MGQKHNRRRTRPRSRNRINNHSQDEHQLAPSAQPTPFQGPPFQIASAYPSRPSTAPLDSTGNHGNNAYDSISIPSAQKWHNRYSAWQSREERQRQEAAKIEAEQCRLFGGEPGDDVALCYRMLEYFGGLDYIDSLRDEDPWE